MLLQNQLSLAMVLSYCLVCGLEALVVAAVLVAASVAQPDIIAVVYELECQRILGEFLYTLNCLLTNSFVICDLLTSVQTQASEDCMRPCWRKSGGRFWLWVISPWECAGKKSQVRDTDVVNCDNHRHSHTMRPVIRWSDKMKPSGDTTTCSSQM